MLFDSQSLRLTFRLTSDVAECKIHQYAGKTVNCNFKSPLNLLSQQLVTRLVGRIPSKNHQDDLIKNERIIKQQFFKCLTQNRSWLLIHFLGKYFYFYGLVKNYSVLMPEILITFFHFCVSLRIKSENSSFEFPPVSAPNF